MRFYVRAPRCPHCGSREYAISRPRGVVDIVCLGLRAVRPVRCRDCLHRWYVFQWLPGAKPLSLVPAEVPSAVEPAAAVAAPPPREERRATRRYAFSVPALYRIEAGQEGGGECVNICAGGLLFRGEPLLPGGSEVLMYLKLGSRQVLAQAAVVWTGSGVAGVRFLRPVAELPEVIELLEELAAGERRSSRRVAAASMVRIRRESGETEVVPPIDLSRGGFAFESVQHYSLHECVWVAPHFRPEDRDPLELRGAIVRAAPVAGWEAQRYGVKFEEK